MSQTSCNRKKRSRWKDINTHTHAHAHAHTHTHTPALKITADQRSLTVVTAFLTGEKLRRTVTMTANTYYQQLLTTSMTIFATSFKIIFAILCHRKVKQTKSTTEMLCKRLGITRRSVTI